LFSLVVSVIFSQVFSYTIGMGVWIGFAAFLAFLLLFFGFIVLHGRKHKTESVDQVLELRRLQAYDRKEYEDM